MATTPPRTSLDSFPPSSPAKPSSGPSADVAAFAPIRSSQDYGNHLDSDLEDDYDSSATYAAPSRTGTGRHRATPSTQGLLAGGDDSDDAPGSPRTARRQTKLRRTHEVAQEEDYEGRPSWRSSGREFLRRNEGERLTRQTAPGLRLLCPIPRGAGFTNSLYSLTLENRFPVDCYGSGVLFYHLRLRQGASRTRCGDCEATSEG